MPFLFPLGFLGTPSAAGSSATSTAGSLVGVFLDSDQAIVSSPTVTTFSGLAFGSPAANRLLIAAIHIGASGNFGDLVPSSVTIGGVAGTLVKSVTSDEAHTSIWQALVTSATSGSAVIHWGVDDINHVAIGLWSIKTNTQGATNSGSGTGPSFSMTVPTNGYAVVAYTNDRAGETAMTGTPTGFTEDYDRSIAEPTDASNLFLGGHATTSATIDVTSSLTPTDGEALVYASWGP